MQRRGGAEWRLYRDRRVVGCVVPDAKWPGMWRVQSPEGFRKWSTWPGRGMPRSIGPRHRDATKFFNKINGDFQPQRHPCV